MYFYNRRVAVALVLGAAAGMSPQLAFAQDAPVVQPGATAPGAAAPGATAPGVIDPKARELLQQMRAAYKALKSYSGTMTMEGKGKGVPKFSATIAWQKPNRFAVVSTGAQGVTRAVSNGTNYFMTMPGAAKKYLKVAAPSGEAVTSALWKSGLDGPGLPILLAGGDPLQLFDPTTLKSLAVGADDTIDGAAMDTVVATLQGSTLKGSATFVIGKTDHLLRRLALAYTVQGQQLDAIETESNIVIDSALPASTFAFKPPAGAQPIESMEPPAYDPRLKIGARPLDFQAKDLTGRPLSLQQYRGKVVLLDFWATWCGPCVGEAPNVVAAYNKFKGRGFDIVGISLDESRASLLNFTRRNKMPWRQVFDGKGWDSRVPGIFGVKSIPFALLIGRDGKIAAMDVRGPSLEPAIKAALANG